MLITEFDLSLKSYFQKMKNGNLDHKLNDHEINITKTNELFLHLQKRHKFNQIKYLSIQKNIQKKNEN